MYSKDPITFYFRYCGETVRVWNSAWSSDQFEVLTLDEFAVVEKLFTRFNIELREATDD